MNLPASIASVCLSTLPRLGCNSHSILIKLCTVVWNPKCKIEFVGGQNPIIPSPIFLPIFTPVMLFQWKVPNTTVTMLMYRLWSLIAQRTLLSNCYTVLHLMLKNVINLSLLAVNPKLSFSANNNTIIQIIAKCLHYCRLLAAWNCVAQLHSFNMFLARC